MVEKTNFWIGIINTISIVLLFILWIAWFRDYPILQDKIDNLEREVQMIDYHLNHSKKDTIVINCQTVTTKKK